MNKTYLLRDELKIGEGAHRIVYEHPENHNRCIKIVKPRRAHKTKEHLLEQRYYKVLEKNNISWEMLPRYYGNVATNFDEGAVFDLIRDHNGEVSSTLRDYLQNEDAFTKNQQGLAEALTQFRIYMETNGIVTRRIATVNLVYQKIDDNRGRLVLIDNIGNTDFVPLANYMRWFACLKFRRRWQRFRQDISEQHGAEVENMLNADNAF